MRSTRSPSTRELNGDSGSGEIPTSTSWLVNERNEYEENDHSSGTRSGDAACNRIGCSCWWPDVREPVWFGMEEPWRARPYVRERSWWGCWRGACSPERPTNRPCAWRVVLSAPGQFPGPSLLGGVNHKKRTDNLHMEGPSREGPSIKWVSPARIRLGGMMWLVLHAPVGRWISG
jgi:hypothetical protein